MCCGRQYSNMRLIDQDETILGIIAYSSLALLGISAVVITTLLILEDSNENIYECLVPDPPPDISFTPYDNGTLKVSWTTFETDRECGVNYYLMFSYKGREWDSFTSNDFMILENLYDCSLFIVRIWSVDNRGKTSIYHIEDNFYVKPTTITDVQNIKISPSSVGMMTITWDPPLNANECNIVYTVSISNSDDSTDQDSCGNLTSRMCILREYCNTTTNTMDINILTEIEGTLIQGNTSISHDCFYNSTMSF